MFQGVFNEACPSQLYPSCAASGIDARRDRSRHCSRAARHIPVEAGAHRVSVCARRWHVLAKDMQESTGQPFIVDNRTGAGGSIAAQAMSTAEPDGYTLFVRPTGISSITPHLRKLPYETSDWVPVARLSAFKGVLVVANEVSAKTPAEFIAYGKANPGKLS